MTPVLYIVVPCYNEEKVLPLTAPYFLDKIEDLVGCGKISPDSKVLFVDDGSRDNTWNIILNMSFDYSQVCGISLSRNFGQGNALLSGLEEVSGKCDCAVTVDCDGQDDVNAVDKMLEEFLNGADIVYAIARDNQMLSKPKKVFCNRKNKNNFNYRLMSDKVLRELQKYKETNLDLKGVMPLIGYKSTCVAYERRKRVAGKSKYTFMKRVLLFVNRMTNYSEKPLHIITAFGLVITFIGISEIIYAGVTALLKKPVSGFFSTSLLLSFFGGIQLLSLGIIGEYVGKVYEETKSRPRFIVEKRTENNKK